MFIFLKLVLFASIFLLSIFKIQTYDLFYLLKTGEWILKHFAFPYQDPFSYTATLPWVAHVWLAGVIFHLLELTAGLKGLVIFNAFLAFLAFYLLFRAGRNWGGGVIATSFIVFLSFLSARYAERLFIRAEIFSLVFLAAYLYLIGRYRAQKLTSQKFPKILYLFPILQIFWSNCHAGSILGILVVFLWVIGEGINSHFKWDKYLLLTLLLVFLSAFLNPYGYRALTYFLHVRGPEFSAILEWRRTALSDLYSPFGLLAVVGILSFIPSVKRRSVDYFDLLLFVTFGLLSLRAIRLIAPFSLAAAPIVSRNLSQGFKGIRISKFWEAGLAGILTAVIILLTFFLLRYHSQRFGDPYQFGLGLNEPFYPLAAVEFIEQNHLSGNMFNNYGFGAFLIWKFYPQRKVFIDGRFDLYGEEFVGLYRRFSFKEIWDYLVKRYDLTFALLDNEPSYICKALDESPDWKLVYWDDRSLIYVKDIPANQKVIEKYAYKYLRPNDRTNRYLDQYLNDPRRVSKIIAELKRSDPKVLNAHLILGYLYEKTGDLPAAAEEYKYILSVLPDFGFARDKLRMIEGLRLLKM
jgi:hypothetical protein